MKYFSSSLFVYFMCVSAGFSAYLPVVDVTRGNVSARGAFGEEIVPQKTVAVAPVQKSEPKRNVVARTAKPVAQKIASADVLKPNRPSSDLWARNTEAPLRMPRMDEIAVINSDTLLPEESLEENLNSNTTLVAVNKPSVAQNVAPRVKQDIASDEIKQLRAEIARLSMKIEDQEKIARARPVTVRTPIAGDVAIAPKNSKPQSVSVQRSIVPMEKTPVQTVAEPRIASVGADMKQMSPTELKKAFKKTYLSENKHLSTYSNESKYDTVSDMSQSIEGFSAMRDLSEMDSGIRPLEIKITFMNGDSGLSRENYNLLSETASIVVNNPKRAVQIAIPENVTRDKEARKLASRRLAIVEQVLRDTGIAEQRIVPVLSQRSDDVFVLRIISGDTFESLTEQKRNMFGDTVSTKTYKNMTW